MRKFILVFQVILLIAMAKNVEATLSQSVAVPQEKYAAYIIPDGGSDLQLTLTKGSGVKKILSADPSLEDGNDAVQWWRYSPANNVPADQYVFKIGIVLSSREYVRIHGTYQPEGTGGGGGAGNPPEFDVDVPGVDMDIAGVTEENEETQGGYVALNSDDDNNNGIPDKDDTGTVTGENDLLQITIRKVEPSSRFSGVVTLSVPSGSDKIKLWTSSTKGTQVTLPKTYSTPSQLPKDLWVEGIAASGAERDVELKVSFAIGGKTTEDKVKFTVIKVAIDLVTSGTLSQEYDLRYTFINILGIDKLGLLTPAEANNFITAAIEIVGTVSPSGFKQEFGMGRTDVKSRAYFVESNVTNLYAPYTADNNPDPSGVLDGTPSTTDKIYDADCPGVDTSSVTFTGKPDGTLFGLRSNFDQWFTFNGQICSEKEQWHIQRTFKKQGGTWVEDGPKNSIGAGHISTDF